MYVCVCVCEIKKCPQREGKDSNPKEYKQTDNHKTSKKIVLMMITYGSLSYPRSLGAWFFLGTSTPSFL